MEFRHLADAFCTAVEQPPTNVGQALDLIRQKLVKLYLHAAALDFPAPEKATFEDLPEVLFLDDQKKMLSY
ncbi:MAG TPA: hypothetical protein VIX90_09805 [Edaphobacter sp.]